MDKELEDRLRQTLGGRSVLVTGSSGFVGRHLVPLLESLQAQVWRTTRSRNSGPREVFFDLNDRQSIVDSVRQSRPTYVFHLAASLNRACNDKAVQETYLCNVLATSHLLEALAELNTSPSACRNAETRKTKTLVLASSADIYGLSEQPCSEEQSKTPLNPYGLSKLQAWQNALAYQDIIPCIDARFFMLYGPGQNSSTFLGGLISSLHRQETFLMTEGEQTRDFTYIQDAVESILHLAATEKARGQAYNICTGQPTSLRQTVGILSELSNGLPLVQLGALPYRENEVYRLTGNPEKLRASGYTCATTLKEGLQRTLQPWEEL